MLSCLVAWLHPTRRQIEKPATGLVVLKDRKEWLCLTDDGEGWVGGWWEAGEVGLSGGEREGGLEGG